MDMDDWLDTSVILDPEPTSTRMVCPMRFFLAAFSILILLWAAAALAVNPNAEVVFARPERSWVGLRHAGYEGLSAFRRDPCNRLCVE